MKTKFLNIFITLLVITLFKFAYEKYTLSQNSHFTVTQDTIIVPGSEISKYVTGEEVDSFNFRCADIVCDEEKNITLKPLRVALDGKDTKTVIKFLKDNNLSVDVRLRDKRTPLMYSSFRNDVNTTKELINLGANTRAKDAYELTPMAYAIMLGSADTAKVLLDSGVKFEEVEFIAPYVIDGNSYYSIEGLEIDGDNLEVKYYSENITNRANPQCYEHCYSDKDYGIFDYIIRHNLVDIAKLMLDSGYRPTIYHGDMFKKPTNNYDDIVPKEIQDKNFLENDKFRMTHFYTLTKEPNYEQMLDLLLEHNISGQPSKEFLMSEYEECYEEYEIFLDTQSNYNKGELQLKDYEISDLKRTLAYYSKNCNVENSTFTTKSYIIWKNTSNKNWAIDVFLKNYRDDSTKVIYIDKNSSNNK